MRPTTRIEDVASRLGATSIANISIPDAIHVVETEALLAAV